MTHCTTQAIARGWLAVSIVLIVLATLSPQPGSFGRQPDFFIPLLLNGTGDWRDVVQNVLLYLPLGAVLALLGMTLVRTVLSAAALSLLIELLQIFVPGRDPVAIDVVTNTAGALLGWLVFSSVVGQYARAILLQLERWLANALRPNRRTSASLSLIWTLLVSLAVAGACWLLSPALPPPFFYGITAFSIDTAVGPLRVGGDASISNGFRGLIDEVRIYSRALTDNELQMDMARPVSSKSAPGLIAAYGFDAKEHGGEAWTASGRFGGAMVFDGTVGLPLNPGLQDFRRGMTLEAWVYPTTQQQGNVVVLEDTRSAYYLRASSFGASPVPSSGARFGQVPRAVTLRRPLPANEWSHLATTYNDQDFTFYVNGQVVAAQTFWSTHHPVSMSIDSKPLAFGSVPSPADFFARLSSDFTLTVTIECGRIVEQPAPVFLVMGIQSIEVLVVEAAGSELRVRSANRAREMGLASSSYRVPNALSSCSPGNRLSMTVKGPLQNPALEVSGAGAGSPVAPGLDSGWAFFVDSERMPPWLVASLSALYLAALAFPFGFWARVHPLTVLGALVLAASLLVLPLAWKLPAAGMVQRAIVLTGVSVGVIAARWRGRLSGSVA